MDRTDDSDAISALSPLSTAAPTATSRGSQSRIPAAILWILAAAVIVRLVTGLVPRNASENQVGLVRFVSQDAAAASARAAGKLTLYDFTAAWCAPCHRLDSEGWSDSRIASVVNEGFVAVRVIDREQEDGRNTPAIEALQKRYSVTAFPTLVAADASGGELARMEGYGGKGALIGFLEDARKKAQGR
jgi:thiol:disulfide interchange protein